MQLDLNSKDEARYELTMESNSLKRTPAVPERGSTRFISGTSYFNEIELLEEIDNKFNKQNKTDYSEILRRNKVTS